MASVIVAAGAICVSADQVAAQAPKTPRVGFLSPAGPAGPVWGIEGFREGLKELGYIEGRNIALEYRWAHHQFDRLPDLAAELVHLEVDVIVAVVTQASLAAKAATRTIPIVMMAVADPVGAGLVASLAHPAGNVTGTSAMTIDVVGKQLELLKEIDPSVSRAAVLWNPANAVFQTLQLRQMEAASRSSGVQIQLLEASSPNDFESAFAAMRREGARAVVVLGDPLFALHRKTLAQLAAKHGLLAVSGFREFADAGGLVTYGPSYFHASKRAAVYMDKILKGAKPGDLPIEQPARFELVINLKAAQSLAVDLPPALLARADEVIE